MRHRHHRTERSIRSLFLRGAERSDLLAELRSCARCRSLYRQHAELERQLCGGDPATPFAADRIEVRLFATLERQEREAPSSSLRGALATLRDWRAVATVATVAVALLLILWPPSITDDRVALDAEMALRPLAFVARGTALSEESRVGVRAFALTPDRSAAAEPAALALGDLLTFSYTNAHEEVGYLALFGVQEQGDIRWYYPTYGERQSIVLERGVVDRALGHGFRLEVNHAPGPLYIIALFSHAPLSTAEIERAVALERDRRLFIVEQGALRLPLQGALQHSFTTEIAPRE